MTDSPNMEVVYLPLGSLNEYEGNAKIHDEANIEAIKASIVRFGNCDPIGVWTNPRGEYEIVEGHGRKLALEELGYDEVPCITLDHLTDEERRAYTLAHNQTTLMSGFDIDKLNMELDALADFQMEDFGFEGVQMEDFDYKEVEEVEPDFDAPTRCQPGDVWLLGDHRLMCGDSTDPESVERLMDGQLADMAFTDPPWNVNYGAVDKSNAQGYKPRTILNDFMGTEDFKDFMFKAFHCLNLAQKDGAMTYVVMSAQEWGNMMLTLAQNDYHWSSTVIWKKDSLVLSRKDYHTQYEPIWYGWKEGTRLCPLEDRKQSDVWDIPRPKRSEEHPTMKPIELVARAVCNSSRKGDAVIDLFGGSGSTLIACEQTGRTCYTMELDPHYCDVIIKRWEDCTGREAVRADG